MRISSKVWVLLFSLSLSFLNISCATQAGSADSETSSGVGPDAPLVQPEYRLREDRQAFEEIRSQIPEEKKVENDDLAYMEKLFVNPLEQPSKIRNKFYKLLTKKRNQFSKDMTKRREAFVKKERKDREQFTKDIEAERKEFKRSKTAPDERKEFYAGIEQKRKDFYANQREKRDEFEAQMRDDRKNFEDYAREKTNDFNARHREFSAKQRDILKQRKDSQPAGQ